MSVPQPSARLIRSDGVLAVADVSASVRFYRDQLGFGDEWTWGDPPDFGGVRWGKVNVMFCLQPQLAAHISGHQHAFAVERIDDLYALHEHNGVQIISPLEAKPWGLREYTVRDLNGYHLRFGEPYSEESRRAARGRLRPTISSRGSPPRKKSSACSTRWAGQIRRIATWFPWPWRTVFTA